MNIDEKTRCVTAKSVEPFFSAERHGMKPNTLRVVEVRDLIPLGRMERIQVVNASDPTDSFFRDIESVYDVTDALEEVIVPSGHRLVLVSWRVPECV